VVKHLPVEMFQQCWSASSYMRTHHAYCSEWLYTVFLSGNTLLTLWSPVAWIPPSALLSCPRKQLPSAFWHTCLVNVCVSTALTAVWFNIHKWNPGFITCDPEIHCHLCGVTLKTSKPKQFSTICVHLLAFSEPILCKTCGRLPYLWQSLREQCLKFVEISHESCEVPSFHIYLINALNKIVRHSLQMASHMTLHHEHLFAHLWTFFTISYYRILTMVYNFQRYWVFLLYPSSWSMVHGPVMEASSF
jgi:hypothetical protein